MSEKQVMIISFVVLGVILLLGGGVIYYLQFEVLEAKNQELATAEKELNDAKAKVAQIEGIKKEIDKLRDQIKTKEVRIPDLTRLEYDEFANLLDELRKQAGVFVSTGRWIQVQKPQPVPGRPTRTYPPTIHKVQYELSVSGGFFQLLKFVNLLEEHKRFINVDSFTIIPMQVLGTSGQPTIPRREMKVMLYSFTYKSPQGLAIPPVPPEAKRSGKSTEPPTE